MSYTEREIQKEMRERERIEEEIREREIDKNMDNQIYVTASKPTVAAKSKMYLLFCCDCWL